MYTGVPTWTRLYRSITSGINIRTQPCENAWPIESVSSVPWIPAPSQSPIQRAFSGSLGPGGITCPASEPAQGLFGTLHEGSTTLFWMWYKPLGVSRPCMPTAIG